MSGSGGRRAESERGTEERRERQKKSPWQLALISKDKARTRLFSQLQNHHIHQAWTFPSVPSRSQPTCAVCFSSLSSFSSSRHTQQHAIEPLGCLGPGLAAHRDGPLASRDEEVVDQRNFIKHHAESSHLRGWERAQTQRRRGQNNTRSGARAYASGSVNLCHLERNRTWYCRSNGRGNV